MRARLDALLARRVVRECFGRVSAESAYLSGIDDTYDKRRRNANWTVGPNNLFFHFLETAARRGEWADVRAALRRSPQRYFIVDAKGSVQHRLHTIASVLLGPVERLKRPLLVVWSLDADTNCPLRQLLHEELPFALLELNFALHRRDLPGADQFQLYDYMQPAGRGKLVTTTPTHDLYFKSDRPMSYDLTSADWLRVRQQLLSWRHMLVTDTCAATLEVNAEVSGKWRTVEGVAQWDWHASVWI